MLASESKNYFLPVISPLYLGSRSHTQGLLPLPSRRGLFGKKTPPKTKKQKTIKGFDDKIRKRFQ